MAIIQQLFVGQAGAIQPGQELFTANGTWTCPAGVSSVSVVAVGAGGGSGHQSGAGGGALSYRNNCTVVPGTSYSVTVGTAPSAGSAGGGGLSSVQFESGSSNFVQANGGACLLYTSPSPRDRG